MIFVILAALSGLVWGVGDFAGGKGTQRVAALTVAVLSKLASLPLLALYLVLLHDPLRPEVLGWGAVAGVFGMAGLVIFYRALASGAMAVVAPVSAVTAAVLPMVVGLAMGERPGALPLTGAGCAIVAIALVSAAPGGTHRAVVTGRLIVMSLLAGGGFGTFFVFMQRAGAAAAGAGAGLWPVLAAQVASLALGAILLWRRGAGRRHDGGRGGAGGRRWAVPAGATWRWIVLAGALDMSANALYLLAVQGGDLSIVAPIAALYPVTTVLLAMLVDRERMRPIQLAGLGLAATALVLVAS